MALFDNSYVRDLPGTFLPFRPAIPPAPRLIRLNRPLADALGLTQDDATLTRWLSGAEVPPGAEPVAMAYAGHQFGGFSPQLGDGRAVLLGEITTPSGRHDLHLKGAGRTPFARGGDGKAVLGPMLREYLVSEAMHALGVPTTRALAVCTTGEEVRRDTALPGAVLARTAASHIRVGTFQFLAARGDQPRLRALLAHSIARHDPALAPDDALGFLRAVTTRQTALIAQWMGLGFIHGVMNTDNMAVSGETIDYGPCAFMDAYHPATVFSSIDRQGRYAWANQPLILGWNLARLAETLLPLLHPDPDRAVDIANTHLDTIAPGFDAAWSAELARKTAQPDATLARDLLTVMQAQGADWTVTFRALARAADGDPAAFNAQLDAPDWLARWQAQVPPDAPARLRQANPAVIPRNHLVEQALDAATAGDMAPFDRLLHAVTHPFDVPPAYPAAALPPPKGLAPVVTFCGT